MSNVFEYLFKCRASLLAACDIRGRERVFRSRPCMPRSMEDLQPSRLGQVNIVLAKYRYMYIIQCVLIKIEKVATVTEKSRTCTCT